MGSEEMDRSGIRRSYRKTIYVAALIFVVALAAAVGLAQGEGLLRWLLAGFGGLLAVVAGIVVAGGLFVLRREADQERGKGWIPRSIDPPSSNRRTTGRRELRVGDWVEVRSAQEILATLDAKGTLDALPFMPEMLADCGKRFVVSHRADKILDMIDKTGFRMRRMHRAVFLDDVRCDGSAHDGCQQGCRIIWKTAWLRRVDAGQRRTGARRRYTPRDSSSTPALHAASRPDRFGRPSLSLPGY